MEVSGQLHAPAALSPRNQQGCNSSNGGCLNSSNFSASGRGGWGVGRSYNRIPRVVTISLAPHITVTIETAGVLSLFTNLRTFLPPFQSLSFRSYVTECSDRMSQIGTHYNSMMLGTIPCLLTACILHILTDKNGRNRGAR
jgi:hypothetical protein